MTTRRQLRESWGLCNWHTWIAVDTRPTASGIAILYEDLLRVCHERVRDRRDRRPGPMTRLRAWLRGFAVQAPAGPVSSVVADYGARPRCALCAQLRISEAHCLDALLRFAEDPELDQAYQRSGGLCVPHLLGALARGSGTPGLEKIVACTLAKWQALRGDLARFVAKHEYRSTTPITEEEARSYHLALEILAGRRAIFGNALHPD